MTDERNEKYRVWCLCDFEERFASELVAKAEQNRHEESCPNNPEIEEL